MQTDTPHYYRFSYRSSTGGSDPQAQVITSILGYVLVDLIIKTEQPLEEAQPVINWIKSRSDWVEFASWDEFDQQTVRQHRANLENRAIDFDPTNGGRER